jgi:predicted permease
MKTIVTPLREAMTGRTAKPLAVLFAAVGLILLIAIANVATLLSSRAAARQREISLRSALGASRSRVVRQLLTESIALALVGAVVGIAFAYAAVRTFTHSTLVTLPRIDEVHVDLRVLGFTLVASLTSGILFGLLPAAGGAKASLTSDLKAGQRESAQRSTRRFNNGLVVAQLSLSVVLLVAAGLVLKSFQRLMHTDLGYRPEGVTSISLQIPPSRVTDANAAKAFYTSLLNDVRAVPGIKTATLAASLPFEGNSNYDGLIVEGRTAPETGNDGQTYDTSVSPGFFSTVGIPMLHGRDFTVNDDTTTAQVAIINEALAKKYWKGGEAIGKRLRNGGDPNWSTVIGVVGSTRDDEVAKEPEPHIYKPLLQQGGNRISLGIRTDGDPSGVIPAVRQVILRIEPGIPLDVVRPLASYVDQSLATRRLTQILLGAFAVIAVFLASVGIYGVMSLSVANRNREFGVRLAVGAEPSSVIRLVLREGAMIAAIGIAIGIAAALVATRWIASMLYGVSATDPFVFVSLSALLGLIAVGACWVPARRAARSDPLAVLRAD